jgi:hypothetical protein
MAIKRYKATADNTIANGFKESLTVRATGSNMGQADVSEIYSIYGRETSTSSELSRIISQFDVTSISSDRTAGTIPAAGKVSFYLRLFNAETTKTVPKNFTLVVEAVSKEWDEGDGLDLENYKDLGESNWVFASKDNAWTSTGGDYHDTPSFEQTFETGLEDLEVDITSLVEQWVDGTKVNYGVGIRLTSSQEATSSTNLAGTTSSYYTKRFFARGTQYYFKKPVIEARWNSSIQDDRGTFNYSSSLAPSDENMNTLYMYNYVRGTLRNIPDVGTGNIYVRIFSGSLDDSVPSGSALELVVDGNSVTDSSRNTVITGGHLSTGIYTCSVSLTSAKTPLSTLYDVWYSADSSNIQYFTGTIKPDKLEASSVSTNNYRQIINIKNLRSKYFSDEEARFNIYVRNKNWSPTIYTVASTEIENNIIPSASFRIYRVLDGFNAIPHGTGSDLQTALSYDVSGNYFNFDMSLLEPGYEYGIKLAFYDSQRQSWIEQDQKFLFRVEDYEY